MDTSQERLPALIPPQEVNENWQPKSLFWQILTGHQKVFGEKDVDNFFFPNGKLTLPSSELKFFGVEEDNGKKVFRELQNKILVQPGKEGFSPQEVIHQSWLGIHDSLRMYVLNNQGFKELIERLESLEIPFKLLKTNLGIMVVTEIPAIVKNEENRKIKIGKIKINLPIKKNSIKKEKVEGIVFFLKEDALQTPADALALADEIAQLYPETAKDLMSSLLIKTRVVSHNIKVWQEVFENYKNNQFPNLPQLHTLPLSAQAIFNQIEDYLKAIPSDLKTFEQKASQRLKELAITPLSDIQTPLPVISKDKAERHLKKILEIASNENENSSRLQKLLKRLEANILKTPPIVNEVHRSIDPKRWLLTELVERGQEFMLDRMEPSKAMIKIFKQKYPDKPAPKNIREWIEAMEIKKEMVELRQSLIASENLYLTPEQQIQYQKAHQEVEEKIKKIMIEETVEKQQKNLKWNEFPSHPVLARWAEIQEVITHLPDGPVKDKTSAVFEAKRKLAEKQTEYTNLFLKTTIKYMPGGYDGWNKRLKGALQIMIESSPYLASLFKELNCVGRTNLLSAMLMEAQVFKEEDLLTMATYSHCFLGGFDDLGIGRAIEGSGKPINSYFGIPKEKVFLGKVFNYQNIIFSSPLKIGLLIEEKNTYSNHLESKKARELCLYLLKQGYIKDNLWYNLISFSNNLDYFFGLSRAASINNFFPDPFYFLLYYNKEFNKRYFQNLNQKKPSPLLTYIKLNLLVMQKALEDKKNAEQLIKNINNDKLKGESEEFTKEDLIMMKKNLETFLSQLNNVEIPPYWQEKYGRNLENATIEQMRKDLWNPDLFPKPLLIDKEGNFKWQMPS